MKKITRRELILRILYKRPVLTCAGICKLVIQSEKIDPDSNVARYLSGSISSLLVKMCDANLVERVAKGGPRGGWEYMLTRSELTNRLGA